MEFFAKIVHNGPVEEEIMKTRRKFLIMLLFLIGGVLLITVSSVMKGNRAFAEGRLDQSGKPTELRSGAWVDTVQISVIPTTSVAIDALQSGDIHFYTRNRYEPDEFQRVVSDPDLAYYTTFNNYNDLTFNPAGPEFSGTGKLNPFDVPEIREAMNWLINREEIVALTRGDLAVPQYTHLTLTDWDYTRYHEKVAELESVYGYDPTLAETIITAEMLGLGAYKVGDVRW